MTGAQWIAIAAIGLPALAIVLWPLLRGGAGGTAASPAAQPDRRLELGEEKASAYRALKELAFDHESGSLSDDDFQALRDRYEGRAADLLTTLDALGGLPAPPAAERAAAAPRSWTRSPAAIATAGVALLVLGIALGVGVSRYSAPDPTAASPGSSMSMPGMPGPMLPDAGPLLPGAPGTGAAAGRPITPEIMARMLQAARESLMAGRYPEAISAYQAVLKRDEKNVDAMTHLALIVAMGGHADAALETFDKALKIDPKYAPALMYKGQVLYEVKQDYAGAIKAWERFVTLTPPGEDRRRVAVLIEEARTKTSGRR
jgi:cytochrome c-type biogenesis protein CcmH/NrfG